MLAIFRQGRKYFQGTNVSAYFAEVSMTKKKSFTGLTQSLSLKKFEMLNKRKIKSVGREKF